MIITLIVTITTITIIIIILILILIIMIMRTAQGREGAARGDTLARDLIIMHSV